METSRSPLQTASDLLFFQVFDRSEAVIQ